MRSRRANTTLSFALTLTLLLVVSCGKGEKVRKYKEKEKETAPASGAMTTPGAGAAHPHFQWKTPEGWSEDKTSSGFRLAAFTIESKNNKAKALCTIVPLQGEAGGLKANVERWLGQISGETAPPAGAVDKLMQAQEKFLAGEKFPAVLIDFTAVTPKTMDNSILVAVISINGNSIFIKITGEKSLLSENKDKFKALCQSFTL
ncbi:MAG: hypothetical protein NT166_05065 [Candidatus Aminicenantes bacterium]|nr:hypothetical protein [Candidatus Aminicenantes bacterium]